MIRNFNLIVLLICVFDIFVDLLIFELILYLIFF